MKRIVQELKEIQNDDNPDIVAEALEVMTAQIVGGGGRGHPRRCLALFDH